MSRLRLWAERDRERRYQESHHGHHIRQRAGNCQEGFVMRYMVVRPCGRVFGYGDDRGRAVRFAQRLGGRLFLFTFGTWQEVTCD